MAWFNWQTLMMVGFGARSTRGTRGTRATRNLNRVRLGVEALEDRVVPSHSPLTPTVILTSGAVPAVISTQSTFQAGGNSAAHRNNLPTPPAFNVPVSSVSSISGTINDVTGSPMAMVGVTVKLTGTTTSGVAVSLSTTTDAAGAYSFTGLAGGTYTITEQPSAGFAISTTTVGTVGGSPDGSTSQLGIIGNVVLTGSSAGMNYNFANWVPNAQS